MTTIILSPINNNDHRTVPISSSLDLTDIVAVYSVGIYRKFIKLDDIIPFGILYDSYIDLEENSAEKQISVIVCPITRIAVSISGRVVSDGYDDLMILNLRLKSETSDLQFKISNVVSNVAPDIMRYEVFICTVRSALLMFPDCRHTQLTIPMPPHKPRLDQMLAYIISYKSKHDTIKNTIIIGSGDQTGYDLKKSSLISYLSEMRDKIIGKHGFVFPILLTYATNIFPDAKIVKISASTSHSN